MLKSKTGDSYTGADDVLRLSTKRAYQLVKSTEQVKIAVEDSARILCTNPCLALSSLKSNLQKKKFFLINKKIDFLMAWSFANLEANTMLSAIVSSWLSSKLVMEKDGLVFN